MPRKEAELPRAHSRKPCDDLAERDRVGFGFYINHSRSSGKGSLEESTSGNREAR